MESVVIADPNTVAVLQDHTSFEVRSTLYPLWDNVEDEVLPLQLIVRSQIWSDNAG